MKTSPNIITGLQFGVTKHGG